MVNRTWTWPEFEPRLAELCDRYRSDSVGAGEGARAHAATVLEECLQHWSAVTGAPRTGEKTPSHIYYVAALLRKIPSACAIVVHRDPRAAACSEWIKHRSIDEPGRRFGWHRFAVRWMSSVEVARACEREFGSERILQLRYEELIAEPETAARRLCAFLGESFDSGMLEIKQQNSSFADQRVVRKQEDVGIREASRDRWRETLDGAAVELIESLIGPWMDEMGYDRTSRSRRRGGSLAACRLQALALWARNSPVSFNQLASRGRYAGIWSINRGRRSA